MKVRRCPTVPKGEFVVKLPLFRLKFSNFNVNVVNQLEAPFILDRSFALSCSSLILSGTEVLHDGVTPFFSGVDNLSL